MDVCFLFIKQCLPLRSNFPSRPKKKIRRLSWSGSLLWLKSIQIGVGPMNTDVIIPLFEMQLFISPSNPSKGAQVKYKGKIIHLRLRKAHQTNDLSGNAKNTSCVIWPRRISHSRIPAHYWCPWIYTWARNDHSYIGGCSHYIIQTQ